MPELSLLMQQVAKGNQQAFRDLAQHLSNRMLAVAYKLLNGNQALAEEAVQEALIKLWQAADSYKSTGKNMGKNTGSVAAYACQIVRNICYDMHRKKTVNVTPLFEGAHGSAPPAVLEQLEKQDQQAWLSTYIKALPERQQQALTLVYFYEQHYKEAAAAMNISLKALERLVSRARQTLKEKIPYSQDLKAMQLDKGGYLS